MKKPYIISLFFIFLYLDCCSVFAADRIFYNTVHSQVDDLEIMDFLSIYNHEKNETVRQTPKSLQFKLYDSLENTFSATLCANPSTCTSEELSLHSAYYKLVKGDVNNDKIAEYVLVAVGQGTLAIDIILGVYQIEQDRLIQLPFHQIVSESLGKNAKQIRTTRLSRPFITQHNEDKFINFASLPVWKDVNGAKIFGNNIENARFGEVTRYRYLWKENSFELNGTYEEVIKLGKEP